VKDSQRKQRTIDISALASHTCITSYLIENMLL